MPIFYALLNQSLNTVVEYPLTVFQIRGLFPYISWPDEPNDEALNARQLVKVESTEPPIPLSKNYAVVEGTPAFGDGCWQQTWIQKSLQADLETIKQEQLQRLAELRYEFETSGREWNGFPAHTDRASQGKYIALYVMAKDGYLGEGTHWKFADGIARFLTPPEAMNLALTMGAFVAACFNREAELIDQINAATTPEEATSWEWVCNNPPPG